MARRVTDADLDKLQHAIKFPFQDTMVPGTWNDRLDWRVIAQQLRDDLADLRAAARAVCEADRDVVKLEARMRRHHEHEDAQAYRDASDQHTEALYQLEKSIDSLRKEVEK